MGRRRPYRAQVYLPGHGEDGRLVPVKRVSAATQEGLDAALERYRAEGYAVVAWEEVPLPLDYDPPDAESAAPGEASPEGVSPA